MSSPFLGQITLFAGNFAPRGWADCEGQLLPISSYSALFSILGTMYGGDGRTTFGLPDLRGRVPIHPGTGPGLSSYTQGQLGGLENNTITVANMPSHSHTVAIQADSAPGTTATPGAGTMPAEASEDVYGTGAAPVTTSTVTSENSGGGVSMTNIQPFNTIRYIIALEGVFPSRS